MSHLPISETLAIHGDELSFSASRSAGPGGQHVNKVSSRITLHFDLEASTTLDEAQKTKVREYLRTRINKAGVLTVSSQRHRSQAANKAAAAERFVELLQEALKEEKERRPTKVPRGVHRRRLKDKHKRGEQKKNRGSVRTWE